MAKSETKWIRATLTKSQVAEIEGLVGVLGGTKQDVLGKIVVMWLHREGLLPITKNKIENNK